MSHYYKTCQVIKDLPGIKAGEFVVIDEWHEDGTYTICSTSGVVQRRIDPTFLARFTF